DTVRMDEVEMRVELRRLLEESIRLRMIADVPVGAFLSGGVDSSAVVALMTRISGERLKTFSIGFDAVGRSLDERSYAQLVAARYGADHTEVVVTGWDVAAQLDDIVRAMDQPTGDGLNTYLVSQATASHVKVALSGLGGDELFAGYPQFRSLRRAARAGAAWERLPHWGRAMAGAGFRPLAQLTGRPALGKVPGWLEADFLSRYLRTRTLFDEEAKRALYVYPPANGAAHPPSAAALRPYDIAHERDPIAKVTRLELKGYMAHTLLRDTDAMSMAHSLEVRVPLIDHRLVEFAVRLPASAKLRAGRAKALLTDALGDLLPAEVISRRKQGFEMPVGTWLRNELHPVIEDALSHRAVTQRGLFNPAAVTEIYQDFLAGRGPYMRVWALVALELWLREFVG
ncbi:MAG: asparagine synthetase B family protein, partial [Anaerolineales bacterium]